MTLRRAHGTGATALLRSERRPLDEIPPLNASDTAEGTRSARVRGRPFTRGNAAAKGRKPAMASVGVRVDDTTDPAYRRALRQAAAYRRRRCSELTRDHGGELSAGVSGMVATAALALAASRWLYERAGSAGKGAPALLVQAAALADKARQAELTAIDLAQREARARPKRNPIEALRERMAEAAKQNGGT